MTILVRPAQPVKPTCSVALQPRQPLPGFLDFGQAGVGILPKVKDSPLQRIEIVGIGSQHFFKVSDCLLGFPQSQLNEAEKPVPIRRIGFCQSTGLRSGACSRLSGRFHRGYFCIVSDTRYI